MNFRFLKTGWAEARSRVRTGMSIRRDAGAIDLASIMVGVIVVGILAGIISASIFGVIPWAQDNAAKGQLDAVKTAQAVARVQDGFMDGEGLADAGLLSQHDGLEILAGSDGACYIASSESATGKTFWISSDDPTPSEVKPAGCAGDGAGTTAAPQITSCVARNGALTGPQISIMWTDASGAYEGKDVYLIANTDLEAMHSGNGLLTGPLPVTGPVEGVYTSAYVGGLLGTLLDSTFYVGIRGINPENGTESEISYATVTIPDHVGSGTCVITHNA